jgi:hypothetical protein
METSAVRRGVQVIAVAVLLLGFSAAPARADSVVYSNFSSTGGFNTGEGYVVGSAGNVDQVIANAFTPTADYTFADAILALGVQSGLNTVSVFLESDSGGVPGAIIDTLFQTQPIPPSSSPAQIEFTCASCPELQAGVQYWLVAEEPSSFTVILWNWTSPKDVSNNNFVFNETGSSTGPWTFDNGAVRSAFEIDGALVSRTPEAGSWILVATGLAGLVTGRRRRLRGAD